MGVDWSNGSIYLGSSSRWLGKKSDFYDCIIAIKHGEYATLNELANVFARFYGQH
jgi:hypothetical protein